MDNEARFAALVSAMVETSDASSGSDDSGPRRAFGSTSLKTAGRIFAMLVNGRLIVKLPARRVEELVESGTGERFDPGHGRLMREWLSIDSDSDDVWRTLAAEAEGFVARRS
jgi:TfoX/Sxy family transcriptional regulator of competence genes